MTVGYSAIFQQTILNLPDRECNALMSIISQEVSSTHNYYSMDEYLNVSARVREKLNDFFRPIRCRKTRNALTSDVKSFCFNAMFYHFAKWVVSTNIQSWIDENLLMFHCIWTLRALWELYRIWYPSTWLLLSILLSMFEICLGFAWHPVKVLCGNSKS